MQLFLSKSVACGYHGELQEILTLRNSQRGAEIWGRTRPQSCY